MLFLLPILLFFSLLIILLLFLKNRSYFTHWSVVTFIVPFTLIIVIGFLTSLSFQSSLNNRNYFRDIFYLAQNALFYIAGASVGLYFIETKINFKYLLYITSFLIVFVNFFSILIKGNFTFSSIRLLTLRGMETILLTLFIVILELFNKPFHFKSSKTIFQFLFAILLAAHFFLSFSRTGFILLFSFLLVLPIIKKNILLLIVYAIVLLLFFIISVIALNVDLSNFSIFIKKLYSSFEELSIYHNWSYLENRTRYWRGYEMFSAIQLFQNQNFVKMFFGNGFGQNVPLLFCHTLGTTAYINLPILHNAYFTILVKYGILGFSLYLCSIFFPFVQIIRFKFNKNHCIILWSLFSYLLIAPVVVTSIISSCTFGSAFFLFGCFLSYEDKRENSFYYIFI